MQYIWLIWSLILIAIWLVIYISLGSRGKRKDLVECIRAHYLEKVENVNFMEHNHKIEEQSYKCPECGLHYEDRGQAEKCEAWCKEHYSCNLDITSHAIENKQDK